MIYVQRNKLIAYEFHKVHQVVRLQLIRIRLICSVDHQQRIRHTAKNFSRFQRNVGVTDRRDIESFKNKKSVYLDRATRDRLMRLGDGSINEGLKRIADEMLKQYCNT